MTAFTHPADVIVLCAKAQELVEVQPFFNDNFETHTKPTRLRTYKLKLSPTGPPGRMLLASCPDMGNTLAAAQTGALVAEFTPNLIVWLGTAATLNPKSVCPGDVVLPQSASARYYDKVIGKESLQFKSVTSELGFREFFFAKHFRVLGNWGYECALEKRNDTVDLTTRANTIRTDFISNFQSRPELSSLLKKPPGAVRSPQLHMDGTIFSSEMVLDSKSYRDFVKQQIDRKTLAVDMESWGFLKTIKMFKENSDRPLNGIVVRGISDAGTNKSLTFDGKLALENAAQVAVQLIKHAVSNGF